ncbi:MAG TPA: PA2928 family protein [Phenylobacterium sp.]|nr:PA2928 family protein [Phenylobacterium sp.]
MFGVIVADTHRRLGGPRVFLLALIAPLLLAACGLAPTPADIQREPVRAATPDGDRVFVLTSQWKTYRVGSSRSGSGTYYTNLFIDVWAFDAANAKPVWRQRITNQRSGVNMGRGLLGVSGGKLWVLQPTGLLGLSTTDGAIVADVSRIEAANPALKSLLPTEETYYKFDAGGLSFTAADGRAWRLNGADLKATPMAPPPEQPPEGVFLPARWAGGVGTWMFMERALNTRGGWFGLLDDAEAKRFAEQGAIGGIDPQGHPRTRMWQARVGMKETFFGPRPTYSHFKPLPEGPEFLHAGLLTNGVTNSLPIMLFNPDSMLVLHRDRLGDEGRLQLTRITGPNGKPAWTVTLPMTRLEAVMPGKTGVVLQGYRQEEDPNRRRNSSNLPIDVDQIVAIDYASGKMGAYGFLVPATKPQDIPSSSTRLDE